MGCNEVEQDGVLRKYELRRILARIFLNSRDGDIYTVHVCISPCPQYCFHRNPSLSNQMPAVTQFRLPDPLVHWPWPRTLNPHFAEVKLESDAWLRSFEALDAKSQSSFDRCNFGKYTYSLISVS
jgi:hypothetical protein